MGTTTSTGLRQKTCWGHLQKLVPDHKCASSKSYLVENKDYNKLKNIRVRFILSFNYLNFYPYVVWDTAHFAVFRVGFLGLLQDILVDMLFN